MIASNKLLVIEDNPDTVVMLSDLFRAQGWFVRCEETGEAGLEALAEESFDLLLLDIMLPDMDGFEIARAVRQAEQPGEHLPIIILTARGDTTDRVVGLEAGADDYVVKPFRIQELVARVQAHLRGKQVEEHLRVEAQQWLAVFESIGDGAFIMDDTGRVLKVNSGFCNLTGYSASDVEHRQLSSIKLIPPDAERQWVAHLKHAEHPTSQDIQVLAHDAQLLWIQASLTPLPASESESQAPTMGLGIWRDVTKQREMAETLRRQNRYLAALNDVAAAASSTLNLDDVLNNVLERLLSVLGVTAGQIHLLNETAQTLDLATQHGVPDRYVPHMKTITLGASLTGNVAQTGESIVLSHGAAVDPRVSLDSTFESGIEALAIVPIRARERLLGTLSVGSFHFHSFSDVDLDLLSAVADQLGVAIENARLFRDEARQVRELSALADASRIISSVLDQEQLLEALYEHITHIATADFYLIALYDDTTNMVSIEINEDEGVCYPKEQYVLDKGLLQLVIHNRQPLRFDDLEEEQQKLEVELVLTGSLKYNHGWLGVPMIYRDKVVGAIIVGSYQRAAFDEGHQQILTSIANQAAVAIENARLYQQTDARLHQRIAELTALNDIGRSVSSILDLDQLLEVTMQRIKDISQVEAGSLFLVDDETGGLVFKVVLQEKQAHRLIGLHLPAGTGIVGHCVEHNEPILVTDTDTDTRFYPGVDMLSGLTTRSLMCVPLETRGKVLGAIELLNKATGPFTEHDLELLASMSTFVAIAIENARLYAALRDHALVLEKEVANRTRELRAILESVADGLVVTDADDRVMMINPVARQWLNLREEQEIRGETAGILWRAIQGLARVSDSEETVEIDIPLPWEPDRQACYDWFNCAADCPARQLAEKDMACWLVAGTLCRQAHPHGFVGDISEYCLACGFYRQQEKITLQAHSAQIRDDEEQAVVGEVTVLRDITRLKELDRLKSQFVSNVSHELKTPLGNIKLFLPLLEKGRPDKYERYMAILRQETELLDKLITDLLDLSRLEMGTARINKEVLSVGRVVEQVLSSLRPRAEEKDIVLSSALLPDLPPALADGNQIHQVATNLIANAINYTPAGGKIEVTVGLWHRNGKDWQVSGSGPTPEQLNINPPDGTWVVLCVADTGKGISAEDMPRIFERFFRGQAERSKVPGTGLGLSIVKEIIDLHEGHIFVTSQPGEGATFAVLLSAYPGPRPPLILIAEDEPDIHHVLEALLQSAGFDVDHAFNGQEALTHIEAHPPDLLLLDLGMPELDGYDVIRNLRANETTAHLPILVLTSWTEHQAKKALHLGANDFLTKPFSVDVVMDVIQRLLKSS